MRHSIQDRIPSALPQSDEHLRDILEHLSDQVDDRIQAGLISQLMARYAQISKEMSIVNRQLRESDMARREAQEIAMIGGWDLDIQSRTIEWSDTMRGVIEQVGTDVPGSASIDRYLELIHPDDYAHVWAATENLWKGIAPDENQYRIVMGDGRVKWINTRYRVVRNELGKPVSIHGTIQDITAAKLAEQQLKAYNERLEELVEEKVAEISEAQLATIFALVKLTESRDDDTGDHVERTSLYCQTLAVAARKAGLYLDQIDDQFIDNITKASPLHDIGKVGVPDAILMKPGKLTPEEFEIMKTHVSIGYETLLSVERLYPNNSFIHMGTDIALYHHEKWDGSGYRAGLSGQAIPLPARIMAIADVYDALRSKRVYKDAIPHRQCVQIIVGGGGSHFDPHLIDVFQDHHREFELIFNRSVEEGDR